MARTCSFLFTQTTQTATNVNNARQRRLSVTYRSERITTTSLVLSHCYSSQFYFLSLCYSCLYPFPTGNSSGVVMADLETRGEFGLTGDISLRFQLNGLLLQHGSAPRRVYNLSKIKINLYTIVHRYGTGVTAISGITKTKNLRVQSRIISLQNGRTASCILTDLLHDDVTANIYRQKCYHKFSYS